jgi:alkylation response protein AidB-like acyl-CoA dehydrogenase
MDMQFSAEELAFRDEVRDFLRRRLTADLRAGARLTPTVFAEPDIGREWQRILNEQGWLGYAWPKGYGGCGWDPVRRYIFEKECALAHAPAIAALGIGLLGPVLHAFGTDAQKQHYLPKILSGEHYWCQGFSEPGSGSDLASLQTRAAWRDGDWIVNGGKLWTTHAHFADHMFCLARTRAEGKPQAGITFLLIDMRQPGVAVRPIRSMSGGHEVNAVFLDEVVAEDMVGQEGAGWTIAKFLLANERGGACHAPTLLADLEALRAEAGSVADGDGRGMIEAPLFAAELAQLEFEAQALEVTELRVLADAAQGRASDQSSLAKLLASTLRQDISRLRLKLYGYAGLQLPDERPLYGDAAPEPVLSKAAQAAAATYLDNRAWTIFGGTSEIQRNIIAKTVLGL